MKTPTFRKLGLQRGEIVLLEITSDLTQLKVDQCDKLSTRRQTLECNRRTFGIKRGKVNAHISLSIQTLIVPRLNHFDGAHAKLSLLNKV